MEPKPQIEMRSEMCRILAQRAAQVLIARRGQGFCADDVYGVTFYRSNRSFCFSIALGTFLPALRLLCVEGNSS